MKKNESGFSLFELMVVIAIISILSAITIPNFLSYRDSANLRGAAFNLKSDLELAKMRAIRGGSNIAVLFTGSRYEIFQDTDADYVKDSGETQVLSRNLDNITVTPNFASTVSTAFNNRGQALKTGTVSLKSGDNTIVITINRIGLISM